MLKVMDFSSDFEIPLGPSQTIDSDSDENLSGKEKDAGGGRSPIIRRSRPLIQRPPSPPSPPSPIIPAQRETKTLESSIPLKKGIKTPESSISVKRRSETPEQTVPAKSKPVRRALDFQENQISQSSQGTDENENLEIGWFEDDEIRCNKSGLPSQEVSSCDSDIGQEPQPVTANRPESLSASVLLATLAEEEPEDQLELSESLLDSAKKRKHVRFGLAEQMAKFIQKRKSHETLEKYQNNLQEGKKKNTEEEFKILEVKNIGHIHLVYGERDVLGISSRFCSRTPRRGDVIRFSNCKALSLIGERKIWFGVTNIAFSQVATTTADAVLAPRLSQELSLKCPCRDDVSLACLGVSTVFQLAMLKYREDSGENPLDESYGESEEEGSQSQGEEERRTIAHTVEMLGGCSSSPLSQSVNLKLQMEVLVHRVFFRANKDSNVSEELTYQVSLLCEDLRGDFCLVRLSAELEEDEHWRVLFSRNWEYFQGGRVTLISPFNVEGRMTRSQHSPLFDVIRSVRETHQRFCYVLACCPGSQYVMEDPLTVKPRLTDLSTIERRYNCQLTVLYFNPEDRVLHVVPDGATQLAVLEVRRSLCVEKLLDSSDRFPFSCTVLGVSHDTRDGGLALDCFSSIVNKSPGHLDISSLPLYGPGSAPGSVVRVEGKVVSVHPETSLQWFQCSDCHSEDLEKTEQGWKCESCGSESSPRRMFELVCDVGELGARVRLTNHADNILAEATVSDVGGFNPADVIGQTVPSILCVVGTDSLAKEC